MIGYYVHHHGSGHLTRARIVAAACAEPVVGLSSLPEPPRPHPFAGWVRLAPDPAVADPLDATAGGTLHWSPTNSVPYAERMRQVVQWCAAAKPRTVVVDVSVEVAALVRLAGVPVVVVTLPGTRDDPAHQLAFRMASRIVAPWPRSLYDPPHLQPFADRTVFAGALSRFDGLPVPAVRPEAQAHVLVLLGSGGATTDGAEVADAARAAGWSASVAGGGSWAPDVHSALAAADVVVTHAGTNALAEVAALRRPAVVLPQPRPFGEQHATADALAAAGLAVVPDGPPRHADWPRLLEAARTCGGERWQLWNDGGAAGRISAALTCPPLGVAS